MTDDIKMLKAKVLQFMDQEIGKYGNNRMDVKQVGELADVIKDLAEAEYYCTVAESMGQPSQGGMSSYQGGYGMQSNPMGNGGMSQGHGDPISSIHEMLNNATPEMRTQIRKELLMSM